MFIPLCILGQSEGDTLIDEKSNKRSFQERWHEQPSPLKATVFSAVIPGAGQVYNKKYWKAPIVWAAVGTCVYFIGRNGKEYQYALQIIDAHVDAHLSTFDISRDLSLHWSPVRIQQPGQSKLGLSLSLQF